MHWKWKRMAMGRSAALMIIIAFLLQLLLPVQVLATTTGAITHQQATKMNGGVQREEEEVGSRPPSCEGRCRSSCGHCQAVQVPVNTTTTTTTQQEEEEAAAAAYADHSNYKPLSWRCKCRLNS